VSLAVPQNHIETLLIAALGTPPPGPPPQADSVALSALDAAWKTYDLTLIALICGVIAAVVGIGALIVSIRDSRVNAAQFRLALADLNRKPDLLVTWKSGNDLAHVERTQENTFGDLCAVQLALRLQNNGDRTASDVTAFISIPPEAKTKRQVPRAIQFRLGLPDYRSVSELHGLGFLANDLREAAEDGWREDDWDLGTVKIHAYKDFAALNVLVPPGRVEIRWQTNCNEGRITSGSLYIQS
jgi:hypothetical protein